MREKKGYGEKVYKDKRFERPSNILESREVMLFWHRLIKRVGKGGRAMEGEKTKLED